MSSKKPKETKLFTKMLSKANIKDIQPKHKDIQIKTLCLSDCVLLRAEISIQTTLSKKNKKNSLT